MSSAHRGENWRALEARLQRLDAPDESQASPDGELLETARRALDEMRVTGARLERAEAERDARDRELARLRESEERWRSIVVNPFDYVSVIDRNGLLLYLNRSDPADERVENIIDKRTIYDYTNPESHGAIRAALEQVFENGRAASYETYVAVVDAWFETVLGPIEHDGIVTTASLLARNITPQKKAEIALRASEERFRQLAENIDDVFFLIDPHVPRTLYVSPAYEKTWGRPASQLYESPGDWLEGVHPEDRAVVGEGFARLRETCIDPARGDYRFAVSSEYRVVRTDGTVRWVRTRNFPIFDADGKVTRVAGIVTDFTERREAADSAAVAEAKYRVLIERLPVISYIASLDDVRTTHYISPQVEAKLGFTQEEWTADPGLWQKRIHPTDRARVMAEMRQFRRCGDRTQSTYRLLSRDGDVLWFRDEAVVVRDDSGECGMMEGVMLDISEAEEARAAQQRARALSSHLVEVQEAERRHIARELHDEIGQTLTGLKLMLEMVPEANRDAGKLHDARVLVGELMETVRDLSLELRPSMLDDFGLLPTLSSMFERFEKQTRVHVRFEHRTLDKRFDPDVETAAYRLVQEALTNVARHAQVSEVEVRAWSDAEHLSLQIHDAGLSFDVAAALADSSKNGLVGMRERVAVLGGQLVMESNAGTGTRLTAQIPIQSRDDALAVDGGET